ncbi:MAG: DUF1345 domain-containing protein [Actinomycetota bacterium]|nr:DUF1345 domain-containing protein [Actinomycetota bacterium]
MFAIGLAAALTTGALGAWVYAPMAGWDVAALVFVLWVSLTALRMGTNDTARHATRENPGRAASDLIVLLAAIASLAAVGVVLSRANSAKGSAQDLLAGFAVASVILSWFALHILFTLRYAQLYYSGSEAGVDFNQKTRPRYVEFAYLAFTIGMTFQVSDTDLTTPAVRSTALRHALVSYLFGAVILASAINLVVGLGGKGGG